MELSLATDVSAISGEVVKMKTLSCKSKKIFQELFALYISCYTHRDLLD